MAITHTDPVRTLAVDAALGHINTGTTNPNGQLIYLDAAEATQAVAEASNPAFPGSTNGVAAANAIADTAAATMTVALFKWVNRDGAENHRGTVTAVGGGGDIEITSVTLVNEPIKTTAYTYTGGA